jgi:hypothetical protein
MDNHLHNLVRLKPDTSNGWFAEDVVRRWLVTSEARNQPISARDWLGSKRSIGPKPSCRGASRNIWPGHPPRWPWRSGMTWGLARIFGGKNIFSRADGEDDRSEIQKDTVATKGHTAFPPIFLPKNILALLPPSSSHQPFYDRPRFLVVFRYVGKRAANCRSTPRIWNNGSSRPGRKMPVRFFAAPTGYP